MVFVRLGAPPGGELSDTAPTTKRDSNPAGPAVGAEVEVHVGYSGTWERGFSVAETMPEGLRLRRRSDLQVLPAVFARNKVRPVSE